MPTEIPNAITPCSTKDALEALAFAWIMQFGNPAPRRECLQVLCAQWAEETGWGRAMHCNNMGNAKSVDGDGRDYTFFACNEVLSRDGANACVSRSKFRTDVPSKRDAVITGTTHDGQTIVWFYPSNPACRFRAFPTLHEGATDYMAMLRKTFASAWPAVLAGDPRAFVRAIKERGYFTAPELPYENTVASICASLSGLAFDMYPVLDPETASRAANLVAITLEEEGRQASDTEPSPPPDADA